MTTWFAQNSSVDIDSTNEWNDAAGGGGAWLTWASLGAADILVANGKTAIAINVDVTCGSITTAATGGSAGGGFTLGAGRTITCDVTAGTTICVVLSAVGAESFIVGNVLGGGSTSAYGVDISSSGVLSVTGNVTGGSGSNSYAIRNSSGVLSVTGNVTGGSGSNSYAIVNGLRSTIITGDVTGGSGSATSGGVFNGTGTVWITGNITATTAVGGLGLLSATTGLCIINSSALTASANGNVAVAATRLLIHDSSTMEHTYRTDNSGAPGVARSLYTGGTNLGQPVEADVRYATTFGASTEYTGSLRVPDPAYVNAGVLTDATVGTMSASLDATALRTALGMASANLDTQIATLATPTNITAATGIVLSGVTHTGAIIPTVSTVTDGAKSLTALSTVTWTPTIAGYIDVAVSSRNAVTPPTVTEFNARTILAAAYFDPAVDTVARVTLVDTTTTNTDMRGTDGANTTAPATPANVSAVTTTLAALLPAALVGGRIDASVGAVATDAINAAAIAADAVTEIQVGLATTLELAKVPKVGGTHVYTQVSADSGAKTANVSISDVV